MKNNKKICIVTRALINGGAERVIAQLANYFVKNGIECSIITIDVAAVAYELDTRINVDAIGKKADNKVKDRFFRYAALRKKIMRYKPDVVLSMPVIVGADGIESDIPINLSGEEALKLKESADALKNIIDTLTL